MPATRFELVAGKAEFHVGEVIGISDVPPDYGSAAEALVAAGLANWKSEFNLNHAAFADPAVFAATDSATWGLPPGFDSRVEPAVQYPFAP